MYYVYRIDFPELNATYIGCTNNLRRRKDQHNDNARRGKSYLGRFLADNGIKLSEADLQVISEFENRRDALSFEREIALSYYDTDVHLLNDMYSNHSSAKGLKGIDNPMTKPYYVIDVKDRVARLVRDVHTWCDEHPETSYKTLIGTAKRKPLIHAGRYMLRSFDELNSMSCEEVCDLLTGAWYERKRKENEAARVAKISKTYLVKTPGGFVFVRNLKKFAMDKGVNPGNLSASYRTGRSAQGYTVVEKLA